MNKSFKLVAVSVAAFALGMGLNNFAVSQMPGSLKIAVVDVQQVVAASSEVNALRNENQAKAGEIIKYIENARKDVAKVSDADKKKSLEEKYAKELNEKREVYAQQYNEKMMNIQNNILNAVREQAVTNNYDMVIAKDVVLYGGDDITQQLKSSVSAVKTPAKTPAKQVSKRKK